MFAHGWDVERERRFERQKAMGIVPREQRLPPRNDDVKAWGEHGADERRVFTRLQAAFAGMLDHADQHIARLISFLETAGVRDNTLVLVLSDNGASQEGGPHGFVNAMGPYNFRPNRWRKSCAASTRSAGRPHSNFPHGWAMASNTPLRRYKQNTHGGGIRDPLVISWPKGIAARGEVRQQFVHASDLAPTLLELIGVAPPAEINGVPQMPIEGESFARSFTRSAVPSKSSPQYFEMFGHRGIWQDGWKAVAFHPPGSHSKRQVGAVSSRAGFLGNQRSRCKGAGAAGEDVELWWSEAEKNNVLPLDDRFGPRFAENAARLHRPRTVHFPRRHWPCSDRCRARRASRSYLIEAHVEIGGGRQRRADRARRRTSGYSLYVHDGRLMYDLNIGGEHQIATSKPNCPQARTGSACMSSACCARSRRPRAPAPA